MTDISGRTLHEATSRHVTPSRDMIDIFSHENALKPVSEAFKTSHHVQSRDFDIRANPLTTIYAALELQFGLIRAITPEYSEYKFEPTNLYFRLMEMEKSPERQGNICQCDQETEVPLCRRRRHRFTDRHPPG